jgi:hypothetical protein
MDISGHAELIAIRNACSALQTLDLSGCTLYTTAEPCFMCSYAIRQTHISKVIIGRPASKAGGISSHPLILRDAQIAGWGGMFVPPEQEPSAAEKSNRPTERSTTFMAPGFVKENAPCWQWLSSHRIADHQFSRYRRRYGDEAKVLRRTAPG